MTKLLWVLLNFLCLRQQYLSDAISATAMEERLRGKPARNICEAALAVAEDSFPVVSQSTSQFSVDGIPLLPENLDHPKLDARENYQMKSQFYREYNSEPSHIVKMHLTDEIREEAIAHLEIARGIQSRIDKILENSNARGQSYKPFRLEFDPAVLFVPACIDFMEKNRHIVKRESPEVQSCQCNAFTVPAGGTPLGLHHATSVLATTPVLYARGFFAVEHHISFHTALTPTNISTAPLVMFDDEVPWQGDTGHLIQKLRENAQSTQPWRPDLVGVARASLLATRYTNVPFGEKFTHRQFVEAVYHGMMRCPSTDNHSSIGTYWDLEPGEAIHFNNFRMHSDHRFGMVEYDRHTLDLRCYGPVPIPFPFQDEHNFLWTVQPQMIAVQDTTVRCLLKLFDYEDEDDFYHFIGVKKRKPLSYALGSLLFNFANAGEYSLLSESMTEAMRKHAQRVRQYYRDDSLNYTAFAECTTQYSESLKGGDRPFRDVLLSLPQSDWALLRLLLIILFGSRLLLGRSGELSLVLFLLLSCLAMLIRARFGYGMKRKMFASKQHVD